MDFRYSFYDKWNTCILEIKSNKDIIYNFTQDKILKIENKSYEITRIKRYTNTHFDELYYVYNIDIRKSLSK